MIAAISLTLRKRRDVKYNDPAAAVRVRAADRVRLVDSAESGSRQRQIGRTSMMTLTLPHFLVLGAILFAIGVFGIFLNRRNLIVLLMSVELMLLAVNMNFVAFSTWMGDEAGQVFVFFYPDRGCSRSCNWLGDLSAAVP